MRRTTCTDHCAACGRHFSGDGAFDLHRRGDPATGRRCVSAIEHDDGTPLTLDPVTVYGLAASRTDAERARLASLRLVVRGIRSSVSRLATLDSDRSLGLVTVERESVEDMAPPRRRSGSDARRQASLCSTVAKRLALAPVCVPAARRGGLTGVKDWGCVR